MPPAMLRCREADLASPARVAPSPDQKDTTVVTKELSLETYKILYKWIQIDSNGVCETLRPALTCLPLLTPSRLRKGIGQGRTLAGLDSWPSVGPAFRMWSTGRLAWPCGLP